MGYLEFNFNQRVKIKPTDIGWQVLCKSKSNTEIFLPDPDGFIDIQLWEVMSIFGDKIFMGAPSYFDGTILIPLESNP